jgi:hypothetical protein
MDVKFRKSMKNGKGRFSQKQKSNERMKNDSGKSERKKKRMNYFS